jgi:hypothetical protein
MNQGISGTILAVDHDGERTMLRVSTGGNGSKREEQVALPGHREISAGRAVKLVNFVRDTNGSLVPGENAKLALIRNTRPVEEAPAPPPEAEPAPSPSPSHATQSDTALAPQRNSLMTFSDKASRRSIFNRAVEVAREFADHIRKSGQIIKIQGRDYVTVAGWSLLPAFEAANCFTVSHVIHPDGTIIAEAIVEKDGQMVSRGFGACSEKDRPKVNDRLAMAQTRARGSALKARYSVLVTLAGYEASLADEVEEAVAARPSPAPARQPEPQASPKATQKQLDFALRIFDGDKTALLREVASVGLIVFDLADVPVAVLKAVVERRVNERKHARAEAAASTAA